MERDLAGSFLTTSIDRTEGQGRMLGQIPGVVSDKVWEQWPMAAALLVLAGMFLFALKFLVERHATTITDVCNRFDTTLKLIVGVVTEHDEVLNNERHARKGAEHVAALAKAELKQLRDKYEPGQGS